MNKKHFSEMLGSLDEAVEVARGTRKPARIHPERAGRFARSVGRLASRKLSLRRSSMSR